MQDVVNLEQAFNSFDEPWSPCIVAQINDYDVKIAHVAGEFVWHQHDDTDEFFLVTAGRLVIDLDGPDQPPNVELRPGDVYIVPRGVQHRPVAGQRHTASPPRTARHRQHRGRHTRGHRRPSPRYMTAPTGRTTTNPCSDR